MTTTTATQEKMLATTPATTPATTSDTTSSSEPITISGAGRTWIPKDKYHIPKISELLMQILDSCEDVNSNMRNNFIKAKEVLVDMYMTVNTLYRGSIADQTTIDLCKMCIEMADGLAEFVDWVRYGLEFGSAEQEVSGVAKEILEELQSIHVTRSWFKGFVDTRLEDALALMKKVWKDLMRKFELLGVVRALDAVKE